MTTTGQTTTQTHVDAFGHLDALSKDINQPWFYLISERIVATNGAQLTNSDQEYVFQIFAGRASYLKSTQANPTNIAPTRQANVDYLESISNFSNFKLLQDTLDLKFNKRINIIFGNNGSGKSSLCDALKILASPETPSRPIANVHAPGNPSFSYKLNSEVVQAWNQTAGFGSRSDKIKYFDTSIATSNVKNSVDPGRVVELSPFKLHIFETVRSTVSKLRDMASTQHAANKTKLSNALNTLRLHFVNFKGHPLSKISETDVSTIPVIIKLAENLPSEEEIAAKRNSLQELEKASSEEGLKNLQTELRDLEGLLKFTKDFTTLCDKIKSSDLDHKLEDLGRKQIQQKAIADALIPVDSTLDKLISLLTAANQIAPLEAANECILCKQNLATDQLTLFKSYHDLLNGELETEIKKLKKDSDTTLSDINLAKNKDIKFLDTSHALQAAELKIVTNSIQLIIAHLKTSNTFNIDIEKHIDSLKASEVTWETIRQQRKTAIDSAVTGRNDLLKKIEVSKAEITEIEYRLKINENLPLLKEIEHYSKIDAAWAAKIPPFVPLLKKVTDSEKSAHESLVVSDFASRLDSEYKALSEKSMANFKVALTKKGTTSGVTVTPKIGGKDISNVMSEGEQRIHALALFFAELATCPQSIIVFDDPISSFDYSYIANYCTRIRDFATANENKQLIILTHNWEFFVQLQNTLKQTSVEAKTSIQIIEGCSVIADYSDKVDDLKSDIQNILQLPNEPTKPQKEEMAGKMRRLIECIVNTNVFANLRHQFKQKSQPVSEFHRFTKIVPLNESEALDLKDLYSKLSITEHDDPRNAYVNTDKAAFQTRYDKILNVEASIQARKT